MTRTELPVVILTAEGPMANGSSPELLGLLLQRYEERLLEIGVPLDHWLAPGLPPEMIRQTLSEVGLAAPDELIVWFGWHNGLSAVSPVIESMNALPRFVQARLEHAVERYRDLVLEPEPPYGNGAPWDDLMFGAGEGWLRLIDDNRGCAIDCSVEVDRASPPRIHSATEVFLEPGGERSHRAVSLCTLVTWWLESLRTGAFVWRPRDLSWELNLLLLPASQRHARFD